MDTIIEYQETAIDFFFNTIKWVFNDFLIRIEVYGIPVLWFFIALTIVSILIVGVINTGRSAVGRSVSALRRRSKSKED